VAPGSANVRELVGDGEAALLCGSGSEPSPRELQEAIVRLLGDPGLRTLLGAAARRRAQERGLLWEENVRRIEEELAALGIPDARRDAPAAGFEARPC
jgi:glycosyltransferase involved in cell wall biosynthesis